MKKKVSMAPLAAAVDTAMVKTFASLKIRIKELKEPFISGFGRTTFKSGVNDNAWRQKEGHKS